LVRVIEKLGGVTAVPAVMATLCKLIIDKKISYYRIKVLTSVLLNKKANDFFIYPQSALQAITNSNFPLFATALTIGSYLSGNISFNIAYDPKISAYYLRGFADKISFNIPINHTQAQWFIYWTPKIIQSLDDGSLDKIIVQIEKAGISSSSKNSLAWFDNLSSSDSASSSSTPLYRGKTTKDYKQAYGLSNNAVTNETKETKCSIM
jgi:hypothetical protein